MSQTQIGGNPDNLNNVESHSLASNYRQLTKLVRTDASRKILTQKINITYYKQNVSFAAFIKTIRVNSITSIINFKH